MEYTRPAGAIAANAAERKHLEISHYPDTAGGTTQFGTRPNSAMNEIIIASIGLLVVVVGVYVYLAEKARRRSNRESRKPWEKR
jgi:hypothetical protein